jgi:membrane protein implicated in regulation of membrane protease activity
MTWTNVYLVCFLLGVLLSATTWLLGVAGFHPHLHGHGASGHLAGHGGAHALKGGVRAGASGHAGSAPSAINFSTLMAFLAWFGGAGYLMTRYSEIWPIGALLVAIGVGWVGAALVFWVMAHALWSSDENLDPDDYDVVGLIGRVSSPIRHGGTGEILFQQAGARRVAGACSEDGTPIDKGVEVVITRYEKGLAYVRTWADMAADRH